MNDEDCDVKGMPDSAAREPSSVTPAPQGTRRRARLLSSVERLVDWVFGYDVFVSYARRDGATYARSLTEDLERNGLTCFIDTREMPGGEDVSPTLARSLKRSSLLVLVGTPGTRRSTYVQEEVATFARLGRPLVPIDLGGFLARDPTWLEELVGQRNRILEADALAVGPSEAVMARLTRRVTFTRQATRRLRFFAGAALVLALLMVLASFFWWRSARATAEAERRTRTAVAQRLAAEGRGELERAPQLGLLLAETAVQTTRSRAEPVASEVNQALRGALASAGGFGCEAGKDPVAAVGFDAGGNRLFAATRSGRVVTWDLTRKESLEAVVLEEAAAGLEAIEFPSLRGRLVAQMKDGTRKVWSVASGSCILSADSELTRFSPTPETEDELDSAPLPETAYSQDRVTRVFETEGEIRTWAVDGTTVSPTAWPLDRDGFDRVELEHGGRWLLFTTSRGALHLDRLEPECPPATRLQLTDERGPVRSARFSPSGKRLAVSFETGTTLLFDLELEVPACLELSAEQGAADALEFDASETELAAGEKTGLVWVWNLAVDGGRTARRLPHVAYRRFDGGFDPGWGILAFSPDARWLFVGDGMRACVLYDLRSENMRQFLLQNHPHPDVVDSKLYAPLAFSRDSAWLATASDDNLVHLWPLAGQDPGAGEVILRGQDDVAACLEFSPDGKLLASGCFDGRVRLWDIDARRWMASPTLLPGDPDWVRTMSTPWDPFPEEVVLRFVGRAWMVVARSRDPYRILRVEADGTLHAWEPPKEWPDLGYPQAESSDGRWWVTRGEEHDSLWEFGDEIRRADLPLHDGHYEWCGEDLTGGDSSGVIHTWRPSDGLAPERTESLGEEVAGLGRSGETLVAVSASGSIRVWPADPAWHDLSWPADADPFFGRVNVLHAGRIVLDNEFVLDLEAGLAPRWTRIGQDPSLRSPCGARMVLLEDMESRGALYDLAAPHPDAPAFRIPDELRGVVVTDVLRAAGLLAIGTRSGALAVLTGLDRGVPEIRFRVTGHRGSVRALALSPSGRWLASAGADDVLCLLDLTASDPGIDPVCLPGHRGSISALSFPADERWLAAASADGSVRLYSLDIDQLTKLARQTAGRPMTEDEQRRFLR